MIDLCWNICTSASRWFYCTRLHWNCADRKCFLLPSLYFHDLTIKKSISNHVSLCQGMRFFIGFPITITKPSTNHVLWIYHQNQTQQTMYFVFIIKTRHKSVSRDNDKITRKVISKLFSCNYLTSRWNERGDWSLVLKLQFNQEENDRFRLLWGIFNEYIKQNVIMAVFREAKRKTDSNFYFVQAAKFLMRF